MNISWRKTSETAVSAGAIGTFLSLLNIAVGFGFQALIAAKLGVDALADTFQVSWVVVTFVATVQLTMVTSLLVPRLQQASQEDGRWGTSRLPSALGVSALMLQVISALVFASGDLRVLLLATALSHLFAGITAVPQAMAYMSRRFWIAGIGPIANGIGLLGATAAHFSDLNAVTLGSAISIGYFTQWIVTALGVRDLTRFPSRERAISKRLFIGVLGFTLVSKFQPVLERIVSYQLMVGTTAALGYGQKVAQGLVLFATFGFAAASTASLARHSHSRDYEASADLLSRITLATMAFGSTVCAVALPGSYLAIVILFQRGAFTASDSDYVAGIVRSQLPWVWAGALAAALTAYLYVERRYAQVLLASLAGLGSTLLVSVALSRAIPSYSVAIASSAGGIASLLVIIAILRKAPIWQTYVLKLREHWRLAIASSAVMCTSLALYVIAWINDLNSSFAGSLVTTSGSVIAALAILGIPRKVRLELRAVTNAKL